MAIAIAVELDHEETEAASDVPQLFVETEDLVDVPQFFIESEGVLDVPRLFIVPDEPDPETK